MNRKPFISQNIEKFKLQDPFIVVESTSGLVNQIYSINENFGYKLLIDNIELDGIHDIAHTRNKIFLATSNGYVKVYDITLNPFTYSYSGTINVDSQSGLHAIDDNNLLYYSDGYIKLSTNSDGVWSECNKANMGLYNLALAGDLALNSNNKILVTCYDITNPSDRGIAQFNYLNGLMEGLFLTNIGLVGLYQINNIIALISGSNDYTYFWEYVKGNDQFSHLAPGLNIGTGLGASQLNEFYNVNFF